jgi:hypothetical protein
MRQLRWVRGEPCCGQFYYLQAWHNEVKYTLTKITARGVERFEIWKGKDFCGIFDNRVDALNHAEGLL